jgi:hypothetical protein
MVSEYLVNAGEPELEGKPLWLDLGYSNYFMFYLSQF